uniref:DNA-binding protein S1FA2 n=1 Tax=Triticum urartu TaxID=4572 RepID=A0A8R7TI82_TRIUA
KQTNPYDPREEDVNTGKQKGGVRKKAAERKVPAARKEGEEGAVPGPDLVAAMAEKFAESANNVIIEEVNKGLNPGMIVLLVVATTLLLFFVGNYALYLYAQKTLPPKKKKPVSKKKLKREKLKQGVSAPGE